MKNLHELYGDVRAKRKEDRLNVELKYKEDLLILQNEDVDEWIEICNKIHDGEINYELKQAVMNLGKVVRERDILLEEIKELKIDLGLEEDEF